MTAPAGVPASGLMPGANGPAWHTLSTDRVLQEEKVDDHVGLSSAEAASRAQRFGPNKFDTGKAEPRWRAFIRQFADPMQIVLLVAGVVSLLLQEWETGIVQIPRITLGRVTILRNRSHKIWAPARNGPAQTAVTRHCRPPRTER